MPPGALKTKMKSVYNSSRKTWVCERYSPEKFDPAKVRAYVAKHPDATLWEIGRAFQGTDVGALSALRLLGITLKKTRKISGKK